MAGETTIGMVEGTTLLARGEEEEDTEIGLVEEVTLLARGEEGEREVELVE